jgi:hypothetical protein
MVQCEIGEKRNDDAEANDIGKRREENCEHGDLGYKPKWARSSALSAAAEQTFDIREFQLHISGAPVIALPGVRGRFHLP